MNFHDVFNGLITFDDVVKPQFSSVLSFPRRREISTDFDLIVFSIFWIPACAGMTRQELFYNAITFKYYLPDTAQ